MPDQRYKSAARELKALIRKNQRSCESFADFAKVAFRLGQQCERKHCIREAMVILHKHGVYGFSDILPDAISAKSYDETAKEKL